MEELEITVNGTDYETTKEMIDRLPFNLHTLKSIKGDSAFFTLDFTNHDPLDFECVINEAKEVKAVREYACKNIQDFTAEMTKFLQRFSCSMTVEEPNLLKLNIDGDKEATPYFVTLYENDHYPYISKEPMKKVKVAKAKTHDYKLNILYKDRISEDAKHEINGTLGLVFYNHGIEKLIIDDEYLVFTINPNEETAEEYKIRVTPMGAIIDENDSTTAAKNFFYNLEDYIATIDCSLVKAGTYYFRYQNKETGEMASFTIEPFEWGCRE